MQTRLLLADHHVVFIEALRALLESEFELTGFVKDGRSLLVTAAKLKPDVILLDIAMPGLNGIEGARHLRKIVPSAKLIFMTMHGDIDYVAEAFRTGASGYVIKGGAASDLRMAIHEVLKGGRYVSPMIRGDRRELRVAETQPLGLSSKSLTPRRREVLQLVAEGRTRKEIGAVLRISPKTVEFHKAALSRLLNLKTSADFTKYALEHGLMSRSMVGAAS